MPDLINGLFEIFGAFAVLDHCRVLRGTQSWSGISLKATAFFFTWGLWNLFYYPHLDQWWSFLAGALLALANSYWLFLLWKYKT